MKHQVTITTVRSHRAYNEPEKLTTTIIHDYNYDDIEIKSEHNDDIDSLTFVARTPKTERCHHMFKSTKYNKEEGDSINQQKFISSKFIPGEFTKEGKFIPKQPYTWHPQKHFVLNQDDNLSFGNKNSHINESFSNSSEIKELSGDIRTTKELNSDDYC